MRDFTIVEDLLEHSDLVLSKRLLLSVERVVDHTGGTIKGRRVEFTCFISGKARSRYLGVAWGGGFGYDKAMEVLGRSMDKKFYPPVMDRQRGLY